jgi:hypothetical protein
VVTDEMFWQPCSISTYPQDARQMKPTLLNSDCSTSCAFFEPRFLSSSSLRSLSNLETSNKSDGLETNDAPNNHHELHVSLHLHMHYQLHGRNERLGWHQYTKKEVKTQESVKVLNSIHRFTCAEQVWWSAVEE